MSEDSLKKYKEALAIFEQCQTEIKCPRNWCPVTKLRLRDGSSKHRRYFQCRGCNRSLKDEDIIMWFKLNR